jgi:IMP cyclohydrolase
VSSTTGENLMQYVITDTSNVAPVLASGKTPRAAVISVLLQYDPEADPSRLLEVEEITSSNGIWNYGPFLVFTLH